MAEKNTLHPIFASIIGAHFPLLMSKSAGIRCKYCGRDEWIRCDESFDHAFGTHRVPPYLECTVCGNTADMPEAKP